MYKNKKIAIVLGINADIGLNISKMLIQDDYFVIGTYRNKTPELDHSLINSKIVLFRCDLTIESEIMAFVEYVKSLGITWDLLFCSVGTSEPIGRFTDLEFNQWQKSIEVNFLGPLRAFHSLYKLRDASKVSNVCFLAGGGTNNAFTNYSAYCVAKIGLIKMCELIDDEIKDINIFILGPGFVRTKTHLETIAAGRMAGDNYERVKKFVESDDPGTSFEEIYSCIKWASAAGRGIVGGRNISVVHDRWKDASLNDELLIDKNMYKLRRYKN